jgi:hypothetical protein
MQVPVSGGVAARMAPGKAASRPPAMIAGALMSPMTVLNCGILIFLCSFRGSLN